MSKTMPTAAEILKVLDDQHKALDILMAMLIVKDSTFLPSKSEIWPLVENSYVMIQRLRDISR